MEDGGVKTFPRTPSCRGQRGAGTLKGVFILIAAVILVPLLILGFYEGRKAYWDAKVREMCAEDGGVAVYEPLFISHSQFIAWGGQDGVHGVPIPNKSDDRNDIPVFRRTTEETINAENPTVRRDVTEFVRRSDGKVLGRYVYYARRGGDFPSWAHESSFGCVQPATVSDQIVILDRRQK
jgi:hypothetical protein